MFEQGLAYLLKKFLGSFVEDGDAIKEKVQVGVWSGLIVLENLRLKSSLLSLVDIPISLSYGYIGRLELRIPWGNLGVDPVMVIIDKIYVVIEPKYEWNPGAADRREQAIKQAKLAAAELFANKRLAANTAATQTYSDYAKSWLMTSFINKIIDNIQITIREVHVRYEDQQSCQSNFCVGITLESLHVQSRDNSFSFEENYSPKKDVPRSAFAQDDTTVQPELKTHGYETFHKLIQINHLSMYWNPLVPSGLNASSCIFKGRSPVEIQNLMYRTIPTRVHQITDRPRHHYILLPIDINNYLDMSFNASTGVAKANVKLVITELAVCLEDLQIREIISLAINMGSFAKLQRFSEFRPTASIYEQPAAWWRYAINAVLLQIRIDNKKTLNLKHISQRHRDKLVYTELWKSKLMSSASVLNQLTKASENFTKPSRLDRENSRIYQLIYNRAKSTAEAATIKEKMEKGSTYKPSKQSKYTASLNNNKILSETEQKKMKNIPVATHLISPTPYIGATQPLNKETIELLLTLEYLLDFEDIVMFRSLAERNLSVETTTQSWLGGWVSWMGTGGSGGGVSEEEKRKLFEALKYDPDRVLRGGMKEVNQNEVMAIVSVQVHQASITLALTSPERSSAFQTSIPFLKLELEDMRNRSVIMGDGAHISVSVSLQDFAAYEVLPTTSTLSALKNDGPRNKILFRRELRGSNATVNATTMQSGDWGTGSISSKYMDTSVASMRSSLRHRSEEIRPLFSTVIEILPPNKDTDMTVNLSVEEVEIWISPTAKWTSAMATFVAWPADQQYWSEMEMSAVNQFADFKARFDAKIEYMMQNHQNIIIEARVKAPVVVISDQASKSDSGDVLVIDLGLITLSTEKLAKAQRQKLIDARSHTGFTSDATNTTPVHGGRSGQYDRDKPRRGRGDVAVNLFSEQKQLPSVREPPGWEVLADDEGEADGEDARSPRAEDTSSADQERSSGAVGEYSAAPERKTPSPQNLAHSSSTSSGLRAMDLASMTSYDLEEKCTDGMTNNYMAASYGGGGPAAMSVVSSVHTGGFEFGQDDETLFDVFQCQISQIEIYLISSAVLTDPLAGDLDISKTVIMDKFEIGIEIHASVLPWDITIPPVKLVLDIPEINIKLSEQKLVRLKQFSLELITDDSQAMLTANLARINQLNAMLKRRNSDLGTNQSRSRAVSSRLSLMSNQSSMINIRSKNRRSMSLGETSSVNDLAYFDAVTGRHSMRSNPLHGESGSSVAPSTSRRSLLRTESKRSRSRAGSTSFKDALETECLPVEDRLKKLVDDSYVVGSDDGTGDAPVLAATQHSADEEGIPVEADDDDDSFFSINENINSEEHAKQKEHLQFVIAQRESIRAKLMSDIRTSEADPSKAALHATLKKELHTCEQELQQLRVALVELLMSTEDLDLYAAEEDPSAVQRFHDGLLLPIRSADAWDKQPQQGYKRDLTQASVFKVPPTRVKQQLKDTNNRELVYLRANISVVHVDLECTPDAKLVRNIIGIANEKPKKSSRQTRKAEQQQAPLPVVTCRLKLLGISTKLRHRSQDSKVGFALRELDIEDFIQAPVPGGPAAAADASKQPPRHRASLFLVSSDPTNFGLHALPMVSRYNSRGSTDLLKLKYEVLFGADTLDERGDELEDGAGQDTHNIKVSMGMIGVNIEQSRIALLMLTVHRVLQSSGVLPSTAPSPLPVSAPDLSPARGDSSTAEAKPHLPPLVITSAAEAPSRALLPNVIFSVKVDCISVSLLAKAEPLIAMHLWALSCSVQSRCHVATVSARLADLSAFCMKRIDQQGSPRAISGNHRNSAEKIDYDPTDVQKITLFGRDPSSMLPFFSTSVHFERDPEQTLVPLVIASLKTVPIVVCLDVQCGLDVTREIMQGAILETAAVFSVPLANAPQQNPSVDTQPDHPPASLQPIGAVLDQIFNPLVDACNGRFEVVTGAVTIVLPADSSVSDRRASSISSWQDMSISDTADLNEVRLQLRTVEANIMWGDVCEFGALQGTLAIQGVKISCNEYEFMDPIDIFCKSCVLPNGFFVNPNPSDMVANLTFNTNFPPPEQAEIDRNMCQVAVGVSPVLLHVHEGLLRSMSVWTEKILPCVRRIQELVTPEQGLADHGAVPLLPVPHRACTPSESLLSGEASAEASVQVQGKSPIDIDCGITACVLLYEVVVSVEVAAGLPSTGAHKADSLSQSINAGRRRAAASQRASTANQNARSGADATAAGHEGSVTYLPVFRLVVRKIGSEVSVRPRPRDDFEFSAQGRLPGPHEAFTMLSATCGVDTVDLEHIKFSGTSYKRLLSTGIAFDHAAEGTSRTQSQQCMTTSSSISGFIDQDVFSIPLVDESDDQLTFRFLRIDSVIRDDRSAQVDVHIENVHATLIADAVLALIAVGDVYTAAMLPQQSNGRSVKPVRRSGGAREAGEDAATYNSYHFAHPSSVPMAPAACVAETATVQLGPVSPLPVTLLTMRSFGLDELVRSVAFTVTLSSCFAYIPSERRNGARPAVCASVNVEVEARTYDIGQDMWERLLRNVVDTETNTALLPSDEEKHSSPPAGLVPEETSQVVFTSVRVVLNSMEVFLLKSLPASICNPVAPLDIAAIQPTMDNFSPDYQRTARFPPSPLREASTPPRMYAPSTPLSTRTSTTSLGERSSTKERGNRYHSKSLIFPFGAQLLYTAAVGVQLTPDTEKQQYRTSSDLQQSGSLRLLDTTGLSITQRLSVDVDTDLEVQAFLDVRPFVRIYETSIKPIADAVEGGKDTNSSPSSPATTTKVSTAPFQRGREASVAREDKHHSADEKTAKKTEASGAQPTMYLRDGSQVLQAGTLAELFGAMVGVSSLQATVNVPNLIVYVINDIYSQPVSIARLNATGINLSADIHMPVRESKILLLRDINYTDSPPEESSQEFPTEHDKEDQQQQGSEQPQSSNSLVRRVLARSNSILSPEGMRSVRSAFGLTRTDSQAPSVPATSQIDRAASPWISVTTKATIEVEYYNQRLIAREPLVEPFPLHVQFSMAQPAITHQPVLMLLNQRVQDGDRVFSTDDHLFADYLTKYINNCNAPEVPDHSSRLAQQTAVGVVAPMSVQVDIPEAITVNLTMALAEIALVTVQTLGSVTAALGSVPQSHHDSSSSGASVMETHVDISMLGIRNDSGLPLRYWAREGAPPHEVAPNTEVPMQVEYSPDQRLGGFAFDNALDGRYTTVRSVNLALFDATHNTWPELHDVPLEGNSTRLFDVDFKKQRLQPADSGRSNAGSSHSAAAPALALELVSRGGNKILIVRSTIRIFNATKVTFKVELVSGFCNRNRDVLWEAVVPPNQGVPVPANLCNIPNGRFIVRPLIHLSTRTCEGTFWPVSLPETVTAQNFAAEVPIPKVPGISARAGNQRGADAAAEEDSVSPTAVESNATAEDTPDPTDPTSNEVQWRRNLIQQRGAPNVQTYAHWLNLSPPSAGGDSTVSTTKRPFATPDSDVCAAMKASAATTYCNLNVSSRGIPQPRQANVSSRALDSCMLRTLTFSSPVTVVNLTAGAIEVAITPDLSKLGLTNHLEALCKQDRGVGPLVPQTSLAPGESWDYLSAHAFSDISLSLKFPSTISAHSVSQGVATASTDVWSEALLITGCRSKSADTTTYSIDVPYLNGSRLTVQLEVMDTCGTRVVNVFVPYWVVSNSFLPLQYQHDTWYATAADRHANGDDQLAADQSYSLISNRSDKSKSSQHGAKLPLSCKELVQHSGLGRARGLDGVVLGPELPTRGLVDVLAPSPGLSGLFGRPALRSGRRELNPHHSVESSVLDSSALYSAVRRLTRSPSMADEVLDMTSSGLTTSAVTPWSAAGAAGVLSDPAGGTDRAGRKKKPYSIMQCGFSLKEKRTARLRLRTGVTSQWSGYFSLDSPGVSSLEVASAPRDPSAEDADIARVMPHMVNARSGAGGRIFSFGMQISNAEPPFNRTQVVVLVDRYVMINAVGHPIEVRQVGHDSLFSLRTEEEVPLWWGAGDQGLHMRLARYGWNWSGKFPVSGEGEFSIRLRNDFDNTVFFVLVEVLMKGPYMYVIFKGGEKFSPYRFENHTLHTFKIKQKGQAPCTVLLPYHSSAYAWDEPLMPHYVCIEMLKNSLQSQDEWGTMGTFSFAALGPLELAASVRKGAMRDLVLKVVAQGPTRVLQIFDQRSLRSVEKLPLSLIAPGALTGRVGSRTPVPAFTVPGVSPAGVSLCRAPMLLQITVNVASIGVSLVDHVPQELIFIAVSGISLQHSLHPQESVTQLDVRRVQVDNQLWSTPYPSLLYPLLSQEKFLSLVLHRDSQYAGMEFIPLLRFTIAPFDVNLDGTIIVSLHEAASHVIELLESTYTATHSRAYTQHHISLPQATSRTGRAQSPVATASNRSRSSSPIPSAAIAMSLGVPISAASEAATLSYHDTVDFVMYSPFAHSPRGERLRPSQIDSIHCIQHSLASQEQQQRQKQLQFNLPDSAVKASKQAVYSRKARPAAAALQSCVSHTEINRSPVQLPTKEQSRATMAHFYVRKMLDSLATPSGYANPTAKVYLQRLELSEIRLNASFNPVVTKDSGETTLNDVSLMRAALNSMVWAIGSTFAKIENCPIRFSRYEVDHVFASGSNLGMMLVQNYGLQAVSQVHIVFFSLAALGNPARLIYNLGEGLWDFLYLPAKGLFVSPSAFVGGTVQGTTSLVRTVVSSLLSTAGSLASSLQVGMIALGVVDRYPAGPTEHRALAVLDNAQGVQRDRRDSIESLIEEEIETEAPSGSIARTRLLAATQTVQELRPQTLFKGLQLGIAGVVFDPVTGFQVDGLKGLVIGVVKGSFGLFGRPLYGALGFASEKFDQVSFYFQPRFLANQKLRLQRVRSPRFFRSPNQPLRVYSSDENMGQELLGRVHQGQYRREGYLWHSILKDNSVLLLTKVRVLLCTGLDSDEILWNCPMKKMRSLEVEYEPLKPASTTEDTTTTSADAFADRAGRLKSAFGTNSLDLTRDSAPAVAALHLTTGSTATTHPLSAMSSSLVSFDCPLQGQPVLNIYHEPLQSQQLPSASKTSTRLSSGRKETGFRLAHKILRLASHRQLIELLGSLLRLLPALASADILKYLEEAGINVAEVLRLQQQLQHQQGGIFKQRIHRA